MANIKKSFYDVTQYLSRNSAHAVRRVMGAACENWLRTEICAILNFECESGVSTADGEFAYDEDEKRDISIYKESAGVPILRHHIELKVVYPSYALTPSADWVTALQLQLERQSKETEPDDCRRHGWVFGIWYSRYQGKVDQGEFFSQMSSCLQQVFGEKMYTTQHKYSAEPVFEERLNWRGKEMDVVMRAIYFSKRSP